MSHESWFCSACTVENPPGVDLCCVCNTRRTQEKAQAKWTCRICSFTNPDFFENCGGCATLKKIALSYNEESRTKRQPEQQMKQQNVPVADTKAATDEAEMEEDDDDDDDWGDEDEEVADGMVPMKILKAVMKELPHLSSSQAETILALAKKSNNRKAISLRQVQYFFESNNVLFEEDQFCSIWKQVDGQEMDISNSNVEMDGDDDSWGDDQEWSDSDLEVNDGIQPAVMEDEVTAKLVEKQTNLWKILDSNQLFQFRQSIVEQWSETLGIDNLDAVSIMCHHFRWDHDRCLEELSKNYGEVMKEAGLTTDKPSTMPFVAEGEALCQVCYCPFDAPGEGGWLDDCKHQFCSDCYGNWLKAEVESKGPGSIFTKCPGGCKLIVPASFFKRFLPNNTLKNLYSKHLATSFLQGCPVVKACPGANCGLSALYEGGGAQDIECQCGMKWCFNCGLPAHAPCTCHHAQLWEERNASDQENVNWIRANTKKCPKCHTNIEKNQGCMHMRCTNCSHEFCWMCGQTWFNHRSATHSGCNKSDAILKQENESQKAQGNLQRYMFYYSRYEAHEKALEYAKKNQDAVQRKLDQLLEIKPEWNYQEASFLKEAVDEVVRCRRILQWSYCFGFFLADNSQAKLLFEDHQGRLEIFADRLHEYTEQDTAELSEQAIREEIINLTRSVEKFRKGVTDYTEGMVFVEYKEQKVESEKTPNKKKKRHKYW